MHQQGKINPKIVILSEDTNRLSPLSTLLTQHGFSVTIMTADILINLSDHETPDFIISSYVHDAPQVKYYINKIHQAPKHESLPLLIYNNLDIAFDIQSNTLPDSYLDIVSILDLQPIAEHQHSVLIIDDDQKSTAVLLPTLREAGFNVITATTGKDGIASAMHYHPNAIIIDLVMSNLSGFDVVEGLKHNQATNDIPLIVLTTKNLSDKEYSLLSNHVDIIAHKYETRRRELIGNIRKLCSNREEP